MKKTSRTAGQTSDIGRAALFIVLLLGAIQLVASALLIHSGYQGYKRAIEHEALNQASQQLFLAAQAFSRENDHTLALLSAANPPNPASLAALQPLRQQADQALARALSMPRQDNRSADLHAEIVAKHQHLRSRRVDLDKILQRQPY
ncbi:MAG: hypothetical protein ACRC02_15270, partial [Vogesella sp.]|uniref:hypothetical protein n=1 Tax=Vogesella sp. TaxID=1904252 RepID=UPI003F33CF55